MSALHPHESLVHSIFTQIFPFPSYHFMRKNRCFIVDYQDYLEFINLLQNLRDRWTYVYVLISLFLYFVHL